MHFGHPWTLSAGDGRRLTRRLLSAAVGLWLLVAAGRAQTTVYWDTNSTTAGASAGTTATGTWDAATTSDWSTNSLGTASTTTWNSVAGGTKIATFSAGTNATGSSTVTVSGTVTNVAGLTFEEGTVTLTGGTLSLGANTTINTNANNASIGSIVSGAFSVTKSGSGSLTLSGVNTYSQGTTLADGTIRATTSVSSLGTGSLTLQSGTLQLASNTALAYGNNTTIRGPVTIESDVTTNGNAGVTHTLGTLNINTNTLSVNRGANATGTGGITFGATTLSGYPTFDVGSNAQLTLGALSDGGLKRSITKIDSGTLILSTAAGSMTTSGSTLFVNGGTVQENTANALGTTGVVDVAVNATANSGSATFNLNNVSQTIGALTFGGATGNHDTASAGTNATNTVSTGTGTLTLGGNVTYDAANNPGAATLSGKLALGANRTFTIGDSANTSAELTVSAIISGTSQGINKQGAGTLVLSGANTFTGTTTVTAGTLRATTSTAALGAGNLTLAGGTLELANNTALSFSRPTTVNSSSTITSDVVTNGTAGVSFTLGTLAMGGQTLTITRGSNATGTGGIIFGATTLSSNPTFDVASNAQLTLGALSDGGAARTITKTDSGTLIFGTAAGTLTGTGSLVVNGGTAQVNTAGALGASALMNVTVNGTTAGSTTAFNLNSVSQTIGSLTFGGSGAGAGAINNVATGTGTLTLGGNVTYDATNNLGGATLSGKLALGANRTFNVGSSAATSSELTVSAVISGAAGINKTGAGTLVLSGANSYTGVTTISGGTLSVGSLTTNNTAGPLGKPGTTAATQLVIDGGTLAYTGAGDTTDRLFTIGASGATIDASGSAAMTFTGTGSLAASSTGNRTFTLTGSSTAANTLAGIIVDPSSGTTSLTKNGAGSWTLTGASTLTGALNINAGSLTLSGTNGSLATATSITVGQMGSLTLNNATNNTNRLKDTATVTSNGGTFTFSNPAAATNYSETMGALTLNSGGTDMTFSQARTGQTASVTFASVTANPGATAVFTGVGLGASARNQLIFTSAPTLTNSILPWAVHFDGTTYNLAGLSGTSVIALGSYTTTAETNWTATSVNARPTADQTLSNNRSLNALVLDSGIDLLAPSADRTLTFTGGAGTILKNGATASVIGASGTNETILAFGSTQAKIFVFGGSLTLQRGDSTSNLTGSGGITKDGSGTFINQAVNSNTGVLTINDGTFRAETQAGAVSGGGVTINKGTLELAHTGSQTFTNTNTTIAGDATITSSLTSGTTGATYTLGSLAIGGQTLTVSSNTATSGTAGITFGATTLSGNPTFDVNNGGTTTNLTLGALADGGTARTINFGNTAGTSTGTITLNSTASSLVDGTLVNLGGSANTLSLTGTNALGTLARVDLSGTSTLSLGANQILGALNGVSGNTAALGSNSLTVGNATNNLSSAFSGVISGTGSSALVKDGTGTFTLAGSSANTYTGSTTVNGGTLVLAKSGGVAVGGNLAIGDGSGTDTVRLDAANQIATSAAVTFNSAGTPVLNLNGNTQTVGSIASTNANAQIQLGSPTSTTTFTAGDSNNTTFSGAFSGNNKAGFTKAGTGTLTLDGNSSGYAGPVTINAGTIDAKSDNALGTGNVTVQSSAVLQLEGNNRSLGNGSSMVTISGNGAGGTTDGAIINLNGGTTRVNNNIALGGSATVSSGVTSGATLILGGAPPAYSIGDFAPDTHTLALGNNTLTFVGASNTEVQVDSDIVGSGNVIVNTFGTVHFNANKNLYTGSTTVQNGQLIVDTANNQFAPHSSAYNFYGINGALVIGDGSGSANTAVVQMGSSSATTYDAINPTSAITINSDGKLSLNGTYQNIGKLTLEGGNIDATSSTLYLDRASTSVDVNVSGTAGTSTISGGFLSLTQLRDSATEDSTAPNKVPDATRTFNVGHTTNATSDLTITSNIITGSLVKTGTGTMTLTTSENNYGGSTTVSNGILNIQRGTETISSANRSSLGAGDGDNSTGAGTTVASGATLQLQNLNAALTHEALTINGSGYSALGALNNLAGNNTWGTASTGNINLGSDARINSSAGTLTIASNITSSNNNALTVGGNGDVTINGNIGTGSGSTTTLTKDGTGTLTLAGTNSYQGATTISNGTVIVTNNLGLGAVSTGSNGTTVASGAELQLSGGRTVGGEALTISGYGYNGPNNATTGVGALRSVSGSNTFGGVVTLGGDALITADAGSSLSLSGGTSATTQALTLGNSTNNGAISITGMSNGTGTVTKNGAGDLNVGGSSATMGAVTTNGGVSNFSSTTTTMGAVNVNSGSTLNIQGTTGTTGAIHINNGSVGVGASTTVTSGAVDSAIASATLTIGSGGAVNATYNSGSLVSYHGTISGPVVSGSGTFTVNAATINDGVLFDNAAGFGSLTGLNLTLNGGTLKFTGGGDFLFNTITITGNTILDFGSSYGTVLSSTNLILVGSATVTVNNWVTAANDASMSTIWKAQNVTINGSSATMGVGDAYLGQITFTGYPGYTTTWVNGNHDGWFDHEIRPTPEPATYGLMLLSGSGALLALRRYLRRKAGAKPEAKVG